MKIFTLLLLLCSAASARIGEKCEEFEKRVGGAIDPRSFIKKGNYLSAIHKQGDLEFAIECIDGTSSRERNKHLNRKEAEKLLQRHFKEEWKVNNRNGTDILYTAPNGIEACYSVPDQTLKVTDGRTKKAKHAVQSR